MNFTLSSWTKMLGTPEHYQYAPAFVPQAVHEFPEYRVELHLQANGPGTFQRVMTLFPKHTPGPAPAVAVPFYFPEAMMGFDPAGGEEDLSCYAGLEMMLHLVRRGFVAISADAYHLTYIRSALPRRDFHRWHEAGAALNADHPEWSGVGKLHADTLLLIDALCADRRVDSSRIGIAGHSLGGKMAFYTGMLDPRIKAVLASDFGIGFSQTNWDDSWYWGAKLEKLKEAGMDHSRLLSLSGGKPFFLIAGQYDNAESFAIMQKAEGYAGHPERLGFLNHATGHRPPLSALDAGYDFLERHLKQ